MACHHASLGILWSKVNRFAFHITMLNISQTQQKLSIKQPIPEGSSNIIENLPEQMRN